MPSKQKQSRLTKKRIQQSEDKIKVINHGKRSAIAAGRHAWAWLININVHDLKWQPVVISMAIVGSLLGVILWFVIPKESTTMNGQFNVAVGEFLVQDANGKLLHTKDGYDLAKSISDQIDTNFKDIKLDTVNVYKIWGPQQTGVISDEAQAKKFATLTNATIVIYGTIKQTGTGSFFTPRFYINHSAFKEAQEVTGEHEIGSDILVNLNAQMLSAENPGLQGRIDGMSMLVIGLVYYSVDRFQDALVYFQKADNADWVGSGKETVYLLIGNAYIRQASQTKDFSTLLMAEQNYKKALKNNPSYGRALIGEVNVLYLRSVTQNNCDTTELDMASRLLESALLLEDQPSSANIETKIHYYRGQIALISDYCRLSGNDWDAIAESEFTWVIKKYQLNPDSEESKEIEPFASCAYARLGFIAYQNDNAAKAIDLLEKAISIASPVNKGDYLSNLGDIYIVIGEKEKAVDVYTQAIAIAVGNADSEKMNKYQEKLESVLGND